MIQFPEGFDTAVFASEIFTLAAPFVGVAIIIVAYVFVVKALNKGV